MTSWFRVFGTGDALIEPVAVVQHFGSLGVQARGKFRGDDLGWFEGEFIIDDAYTLLLERYLEDDAIRPALNSWAAWLEETEESRYHPWLMEHVIRTRQLFCLHRPSEESGEPLTGPTVEEVCTGLCRILARETDGIYQVDGQGFFDADGLLLVGEDEGEPADDEDGDDEPWAEDR